MTISNTGALRINGKGAAARLAAAERIPALAYGEAVSRTETLAAIATTLGKAPSDDLVKGVQKKWQIGRVAFRLPKAELPKGNDGSPDARIAFAADLVLRYASAAKEGTVARPLRAGQIGRRSAVQQRIVNAAVEGWSQIAAELGAGTAKTQAERNKAKATKAKATRAPHHNATQDDKATPASNVVQMPPKKVTASVYADHMATQLVALCAFADKHAKTMPIEFTETVADLIRARNSALKAKAAFEERTA